MSKAVPSTKSYRYFREGRIWSKRKKKDVPIDESRFGEPCIHFFVDRRIQMRLLDELIWEHFNHMEIPYQHELRHIDGDDWNCSLDNLELRKKEEQVKKPRRSRWDPDENGFMPIDYYINMKDGVKGAVESGIPQHCRVVL